MNFNIFNFKPTIKKAIAKQGFEQPTPIQAKAIPPVMEGRDVLGLAQTGTGKTAAFALPVLQRLEHGPCRNPRVLVLAPTRELAGQIDKAFNDFGYFAGIKSTAIFGGVNIKSQIKALQQRPKVIVACPGRLLDHLSGKTVNLKDIDTLVIDEADRMIDMGFLPDVRRIIKQLPTKRQTLLFSATMPASIRHLADEMLNDPVTIKIGHTKPADTVRHALYPVPAHLKTDLLKTLLPEVDAESVIIFTRTKHRAKRLAQQLERQGYRATCLQGNLSQSRREQAIKGFRNGTYQILVATDIAARGIDVASITHVINFDMPATADDYTHRIGRTGRALKTGEAYTFVTDDDSSMIRSIEKIIGEKIEQRHIDGFDYCKAAPPKTVDARNTSRNVPHRQAKTAPNRRVAKAC